MLDIEYDYPEAAYLFLLLIPIFFLYFFLFRYRQHMLKAFHLSSLSQLVFPRSFHLTMIKVICLGISWVFTSFALMGPKGNMRYLSLEEEKHDRSLHYQSHDVIFLIDTSGSMGVKDAKQGESRLEAAKEISQMIVSQLAGENVALYAFTSVLTPLVPPTLDYLFARLQLRQLTFNEGDKEGTDFKSVLTDLKEQLLKDPPQKQHSVIIFSDGEDNRIEALTGQTKEQAIEEMAKSLKTDRPLHLDLWTIGIGSKEGGIIPQAYLNGKPVYSRLDETLLKELARQNSGHYEAAQNWTNWNLTQRIVENIKQKSLYQSPTTQERTVATIKPEEVHYDLYYQFPLTFALLFLAVYLLLPDVSRL